MKICPFLRCHLSTRHSTDLISFQFIDYYQMAGCNFATMRSCSIRFWILLRSILIYKKLRIQNYPVIFAGAQEPQVLRVPGACAPADFREGSPNKNPKNIILFFYFIKNICASPVQNSFLRPCIFAQFILFLLRHIKSTVPCTRCYV